MKRRSRECRSMKRSGQMFVDMVYDYQPDALRDTIEKYHMGGFRYMNIWRKAPNRSRRFRQLEDSVSDCCKRWKKAATAPYPAVRRSGKPVAIGAKNPENAYLMGLHWLCTEAAAGRLHRRRSDCGYSGINWRNCVVSNRAFSSDADEVLANGLAYLRGANEAGLAAWHEALPGRRHRRTRPAYRYDAEQHER